MGSKTMEKDFQDTGNFEKQEKDETCCEKNQADSFLAAVDVSGMDVKQAECKLASGSEEERDLADEILSQVDEGMTIEKAESLVSCDTSESKKGLKNTK